MATQANVNMTVEAIKEVTSLFRGERIAYMVITIISAMVLIGSAIIMIVNSESNEQYMEITGLFGSSGTVLYATSKLLKMYNSSMDLIREVITKNQNINGGNSDDQEEIE